MRRAGIGSADLDAETLQTDVMRFMAILSFCLMAILALVRNVESVPGVAPASRVSADKEPSAEHMREPVPARRPADPVKPAPKVELAAKATPAKATPAKATPAKADTPAPAVEKPSLESPPVKPPAPPVEQRSLAKLEPAPVMPPPPRPSPPAPKPAPAAAAKADSLTLRFASDTDFLKLVSGAVIEVYAYDAGAAFKLTPGLTFASAARPPQVHELLEETIPPLVRTALSRTAPAGDGALVWGVRLPPGIESSIERHLTEQRTGVLLIDRNGSVRHVSSS